MLASSILRVARSASHNALIAHQQVRWSKRSFRLKDKVYGEEPLVTSDDIEEAQEAGKLEELSYKQIRFAHTWESCSPMFDRDYERFCRYVMKGGRKELAHDLVHLTFWHIKNIQYAKMRKLKEKETGDSQLTLEYIESKQNNPNINENEEYIEMNPLVILKTALSNCEPLIITTKVKRGGATYQVPYPLRREQSEYLALKWIIRAVLDRPKPRKKHFQEVMAQELLDAFYNRGKVIKKRDDIHRLADANKAYSHYRWG